MGCDIHAFVEYKRQESKRWQGVSSGEIALRRWYGIFAYMAGVRNYYNATYIKPRGLPEDVSLQTARNLQLFIDGTLKDKDFGKDKGVSINKAESLIKSGSSIKMGKYHISDPDIHSMSWLTAAEFESCLNSEPLEFDPKTAPDYSAALALLKHFESIGFESRIVFGFDN